MNRRRSNIRSIRAIFAPTLIPIRAKAKTCKASCSRWLACEHWVTMTTISLHAAYLPSHTTPHVIIKHWRKFCQTVTRWQWRPSTTPGRYVVHTLTSHMIAQKVMQHRFERWTRDTPKSISLSSTTACKEDVYSTASSTATGNKNGNMHWSVSHWQIVTARYWFWTTECSLIKPSRKETENPSPGAVI